MTMTRQTRKVAITTALFLGGAVLGFIARALGPMSPPAFLAFIAVALGLASWGALYCWQLMDEAQQEAHKWAWYWGGSTGLMVGFIALIMATRVDPQLIEMIRPNASPKTYVELGFTACAGSTLVGYLAAWGVWWLKRR